MRSTNPILALAVTGLVAVAGCAGPAATATSAQRPDRAQLQQDADALHALGVTGVQAMFVAEDGSEQVATSGVADLTTRAPVPPDGFFRIGSTGKAFVATVALQLVGDGALALDDPVERWLPGVVQGNGNDGGRITVRQLLQHTSGIHDDFPDFTSAADYQRHRYDIHPPEELVARAMQHPPDFPPGTAWRYSSTGYLLVEMIIERVTGRPWYDEVQERIIQPLGLEQTSWPAHSPTLPQPHARGYRAFADDVLVDVTEQVLPASAFALVSTTRDLNHFFRALLGGRLLEPAELAEMQRTVPLGPEYEELLPGARYGLGLFERSLPCGGTYWSHNGGGSGYTTDNGVTADGRRSVVVSASSVPDDSTYIRQQQAADALVTNALCGRD